MFVFGIFLPIPFFFSFNKYLVSTYNMWGQGQLHGHGICAVATEPPPLGQCLNVLLLSSSNV